MLGRPRLEFEKRDKKRVLDAAASLRTVFLSLVKLVIHDEEQAVRLDKVVDFFGTLAVGLVFAALDLDLDDRAG